MTLEEINQQERRIKEARALHDKATMLRITYKIISGSESKIDDFRIIFKQDGYEVASISGDDVERCFVEQFVLNMAESIKNHIATIEKDISEI